MPAPLNTDGIRGNLNYSCYGLALLRGVRPVRLRCLFQHMAIQGLRPILLIDDSHEDLFLTKRLLARAGVSQPIITIDDGEEAIAFLHAAISPGAIGLLPSAVFCDIRMPKVNGFEVVTWARQQPALAATCFTMLTGGDVPEDRDRAQALGANHFLVKFPTPDVLKAIVEAGLSGLPASKQQAQ